MQQRFDLTVFLSALKPVKNNVEIMKGYKQGGDMDNSQIKKIIRRRLNLEDNDWSIIEKNPKFQKLFQNAIEASKYRLVAEVIESKGCHSGHIVGQKLIFDNSGNLLTKENPDRVCTFLMPNLTVLINAFFENLMNGRNPNEVMFNTTGWEWGQIFPLDS